MAPSCFLPFHGHLRCAKLLLTQINNKYLSSHLHGQIEIATYSCHIKIARVDGALGLERWGGMLRGYFGIATLTLIIEVNTTSLYFKMRKKHQQQNGKLKTE